MTPAKFFLGLLVGAAMLALLILYLALREDTVRSDGALTAAIGGGADSASARLSGPTRCVTDPFRVRVTGRRIARVTFLVDGRRRTAVAAQDERGASLRVDPQGQSSAVHRITADVEFTPGSEPGTDSLRLVYDRCPQKAPEPAFTG